MSSNTNYLSVPSPEKLYSQESFKKGDRLERIFIYLVSGAEVSSYQLTEAEKKYLKLMERAYHLLFEHRSQREALKVLSRYAPAVDKKVTPTKVMADAQLIYGRFEVVDKKIQRSIIRENLLARIKYVENWIDQHDSEGSETDPRTVVAAEKVLQGYWKALGDLDAIQKQEESAKEPLQIPEIYFSDDPRVLEDKNRIEDAQIEEE